MIAICSFCQRKCEWYCDCSPNIPLCTFHTKEHRTLSCQLKRLKISKFCDRIKKILRLEIQSRISKLSECIQQIQTTTTHLLETIKAKSEALLTNLNNTKDSLVSALNSVKNCSEINNWYNYLTKVYTRKDSMDEKCFEGVYEYFDQVFFAEENKLYSVLGHAEQAKYTLAKDYKLLIEGHFDCVSSVAVTNDNKFVVSCSLDHTVRLWKHQNKQHEMVLESHYEVLSAEITKNNKYIVFTFSNCIVRVCKFKRMP